MQYKLAMAGDADAMERMLTACLNQGWIPQGGIAVNIWLEDGPPDAAGQVQVCRWMNYSQAVIHQDNAAVLPTGE